MRKNLLWLMGAVVCGQAAAAPVLMRELRHDVSPPLAAMAGHAARVLPHPARAAAPTPQAGSNSLTAGVNFDGIQSDGIAPPDTSGAAGSTQFVQWVNVEFAVFDKATGAVIQAPMPGNTLWAGFGGACEANNSGQPIAQYDKAAARWVLAQPVLVTPYTYCIAISTTDDATGTYYRYAFALPAGDYPGSPKLAVWPDAYYVSFNIMRGGLPAGAMAAAYDRTNMLAGNPARPAVAFQLTPADTNLLPSDFDGTVAPATGEPDFFMDVASASTLNLFKFHVDFNTPANSTFTGPTAVTVKARPSWCSRAPGHCGGALVVQPSPGELLDALPDRLMYRLAWRNAGGTEHLTANQTVVAAPGGGPIPSLRWYDITSPNGTPTVAQQGSVNSLLTGYWMASIAQDKLGDIALGFSASSLTLDPSVAFTGRLTTDPPGTMEKPQFIVKGHGVQINTGGLWGAYSAMSIDPDDCTFWYTTEYIKTTGIATWSTRIASLRFAACQ